MKSELTDGVMNSDGIELLAIFGIAILVTVGLLIMILTLKHFSFCLCAFMNQAPAVLTRNYFP